MIDIHIGPNRKRIGFYSCFSELTVRKFLEYMNIEKRIESLAMPNNTVARDGRIEQLALLSSNKAATERYLTHTVGVTESVIIELWHTVQSSFTDFQEWFDRIQPKKKLRHRDYKKEHFYSFSRIREFSIFDMSKITVFRESAMARISERINAIRSEFTTNEWSSLPLFLAYALRPSSEEKETSALRSIGAFIGGSRFASLNDSDKLEAYNAQLKEDVSKRKEIFMDMPLALAFSVYKQYFFFGTR